MKEWTRPTAAERSERNADDDEDDDRDVSERCSYAKTRGTAAQQSTRARLVDLPIRRKATSNQWGRLIRQKSKAPFLKLQARAKRPRTRWSGVVVVDDVDVDGKVEDKE